MPFTGTDEIHMRAPTCKYADSKSGFNDMVGIEIRYRQGNLAVFFIEVTEGAEVVSRSGMEMNVRSPVLSYRHPERSRGIFFVVAVLCTYEVMIKSPRCFGCSSSDALRLAVVQGRFLAALEMTRGGRTVIRGRTFSLLAPPLFLQNAPISLEKNALGITISHRYCLLFHTTKHRAAARWIS